jgi:tetratricopeptide (TPR) repeat protein
MSKENLKDFTHARLPWIVAAVALVTFLLTLNHWVSGLSLPVMAKLSGWDWQPSKSQPLFQAIAWPIRLLPGSVQFIFLNMLSAVFGALALALLGRSVSLLPHDRTREQRQREESPHSILTFRHKWIPPVFAMLVFAFQLTFWEHATVATGEMLDLLIFAYVIRCLLEYRIDRNEKWLTKMAFVYGLGVTNNWAMIGFFPFFLGALVWIKGLSFFKAEFVFRMLAAGGAGLLLYLLVPVAELFSSRPGSGFFNALLTNWREQKAMLSIPFKSIPVLRAHLFMISLTSLLPILIIGIRWPSFHGDINPAAEKVTGIMFRALHLMFLAVCTWVFFDPKFSARQLGFGLMPFLTFYYLAALSVGYFAGYALLVFGKQPGRSWERAKTLGALINLGITAVVWAGLLAVPAAMIYRNFSAIRSTNGKMLHEFSARLTDSLPKEGSVVLSDDPTRLFLVDAVYQRRGVKHDHLLVDTRNFTNPSYFNYLRQRSRYQEQLQLPKDAPETLDVIHAMQMLTALSGKHPIYYLHPSFGDYFELFYIVPHGLAYELKSYDKGQLTPPPPSAEVISENEQIWQEIKSSQLERVARAGEKGGDAAILASFYSRALNSWGVILQRLNKLDLAKPHFADALKFNPENVAAEINEKFNEQLRAGKVAPVKGDEGINRKLGQYRGWAPAIMFNGFFDELEVNMQIGRMFAEGGNLRQASQNFFRVVELAPDNLPAQVAVAKTYIDLQQPEKALEIIGKIRQSKTLTLTPEQQFELLGLEAMTYMSKGELEIAEEVLLGAKTQAPKDEKIAGMLGDFYLQSAIAYMNSKEWKKAVDRLNILLKSNPQHPAGLLNRAIAHLQLNNLDLAKQDYEAVQQIVPQKLFRVYFGLGDIAERKKDTAEAIKNFRLYLEYAPKESDEYRKVAERLKQLEGGAN